MDFLEQKMLEMNSRLDQTQVSVETLQSLMAQLSMDVRAMLPSAMEGGTVDSQRSQYSQRVNYGDSPELDSGHKDVLVDEGGIATTGLSDRAIGPEMQIRRLTAQLTAAYGRIAALEEQLLMRRIQTKNTV